MFSSDKTIHDGDETENSRFLIIFNMIFHHCLISRDH